MTPLPRSALRQVLSEFVDTHPGIRAGSLFGQPAAFVGRRAFATLTSGGLKCRLPIRRVAARSGFPRVTLAAARGDWVILTSALPAGRRSTSYVRLLELSATYTATGAVRGWDRAHRRSDLVGGMSRCQI